MTRRRPKVVRNPAVTLRYHLSPMTMRAVLAMVLACACAACAGKANPPAVGGGTGGVEQISGTERLGWTQPASSSEDPGSYQFFLYIDRGSRAQLPDVSCSTSSAGFACSGRLNVPAGTHALTLSAVAGDGIESTQSDPLQVMVVRAVSSSATAPQSSARTASIDPASSGSQLSVQEIATGLVDPTDLAVVPDGRVFVAERAGRVQVLDVNGAWSEPAIDLADLDNHSGGGLLAIAIDPDFARSGFVYAIYTTSHGYRLARFHEIGGAFAERMVVLDGVPASASPAVALRFGPDARLYVGLDDGDVAARAGDYGSYNGKVLRINADGSVPSDQTGLTPVWALNLAAPRAFDWTTGGNLWAVEGGAAHADRLDAIAIERFRTQRGRIASQYALPNNADPSGIAVYKSALMPQWQGDLLVSLAATQQLLRLRLAGASATQVVQTEQVLNGEAGSIRSLAISPRGSIYLLNDRSLLELLPAP
jgi:glucose/arabinose dehydrogenase